MVWETIPGETPIDDISGLKPKHVQTRKELALVEAENIRKAILKYLAAKPNRRQAPFDISWSLRLHEEMFGDVWNWAGTPRKVDLNLGISWHQVESALLDTLNDLAYWEKNWPDIIEQATHLHHKTVKIHPFLNGNGRWARMLANIWLRIHDAEIIIWPEETIGTVSSIRDEYLEAIKDADNGQMGPLLDLHRRFSENSGTESSETEV